jgi:hypothetical protein
MDSVAAMEDKSCNSPGFCMGLVDDAGEQPEQGFPEGETEDAASS